MAESSPAVALALLSSVENLNIAFTFMNKEGLKFVNMQAGLSALRRETALGCRQHVLTPPLAPPSTPVQGADVWDGDAKLILGMMYVWGGIGIPPPLPSLDLRLVSLVSPPRWTILYHYQVSKSFKNAGAAGSKKSNAKDLLLEWVRSKIPSYDIQNFTTDWNDVRGEGDVCSALKNHTHSRAHPPPTPTLTPLCVCGCGVCGTQGRALCALTNVIGETVLARLHPHTSLPLTCVSLQILHSRRAVGAPEPRPDGQGGWSAQLQDRHHHCEGDSGSVVLQQHFVHHPLTLPLHPRRSSAHLAGGPFQPRCASTRHVLFFCAAKITSHNLPLPLPLPPSLQPATRRA